MNAHQERRKPPLRKLTVALLAIGVAIGCLGIAACQPQVQNASEADTAALADTQGSTEPGTFTNPDAGDWGDTQYAIAVNAGNRGCNSCHADLFSVLPHGKNSKGLHEVDKPAAYGRVYTYNDCTTCHVHSGSDGSATGGSGPYMAASIHGSHYANAEFNAKGGNCFSCHESDVVTGRLGIWDELKYTRVIGLGNNAPLEAVDTWLEGRGYETSTVTGGMIAHDIKLDNVVSNQDPTESSADLYSATNMDYPEVAEADYRIAIKGVKNEKSYTLDELRAMPQTEITYTRICGTNGNNGGWYIANIPAKGVLLSDIIADCGGLADGVDTFASAGYDGWAGPFTPAPTGLSMDAYLDPNTMIALEQFGEPIDLMDGGPAYFVVPGGVAFAGSKWVNEISFFKGDGSEIRSIAEWDMYTNTGTWLTPSIDGKEFKVGEPIELTGVAFSLAEQHDINMTAIKISADYGETWTEIPLPVNMDQDQWVKWSATWTPEVAGTYCLTTHVESENPEAGSNDGNVIIKVVE